MICLKCHDQLFVSFLADMQGLLTNNDVEDLVDMFAGLQVGDMCISSFNPLNPNGISHYYQLEQSIPNFRGVGWYLFYPAQSLIEDSVCKQ